MATTVTVLSESDSLDLLLKLLKSDTEEEVSRILSEYGYLEQSEHWKPLGETEGNWSIVGNQQSNPVSALADKIVNSVDAVLIGESWNKGIDPESANAPLTMEDAVEKFYSIPGGKLANATPEQRNSVAGKIFLVATGAKPGEKGSPSYTLIDLGEGQTPPRFAGTLLSLPTHGKPNKSKVKFVQGVYNMGGTGVLPFCGTQNYELIVSKRSPTATQETGSHPQWTFTIIRRHRPSGADERISVYQYLAPHGQLLRISQRDLPLLPGNYPKVYSESISWGTCVKLYEYGLKPDSLRGPIYLDLNYELSRYFQTLAIPVRVSERRPNYGSHSFDATLAGMAVRLEDDRSKVLEDGFPTGGSMPVVGLGDLPVVIYAFKREIGREITRSHWMGDKAIVFTMNGQTHAFYRKDFFSRKRVDLGYLEKDLMIAVDFTKVPASKREDLLMASRDRLREGSDRDNLENALEEFLGEHEGLRALNERRRQQELESVFGQDKPLEKVLGKLLKASPALADIFGLGNRLTKPVGFEWKSINREYHGKPYPTFFRLAPDQPATKQCAVNASCRFGFETDATNDYLIRSKNPGTFVMAPMDAKKSVRLWNGIASLTVKAPVGTLPGTRIPISIVVTDAHRAEAFPEISIEVQFQEPMSHKDSKAKRKNEGGQDSASGRSKSTDDGTGAEHGLELPRIVTLVKTDPKWKDHFSSDTDGVDPVRNADKIDIFVNMSNPSLISEISTCQPGEKFVLENQFKYGLALVALGMFYDYNEGSKAQVAGGSNGLTTPTDTLSEIRKASRGVAIVLLPLTNSLGSIANSL